MSNFLANYDLYTSGNEVNRNYHTWTALAVLSTLVSRKVWIDLGYFKVYPNLYVVLLGPPGNKKTSAMSIGKKLVARVDDSLISADCQSAQDTVKMLADTGLKVLNTPEGPYSYSPLTIFATELSQFVEIDPARMIDLWVTIFDCETYTKRTLKHNAQTIVNPFFTILGCTTPSWVTRYLRTDIITGGFSRRCVFVLEDYNDDRRVPFPEITEEMRTAYDACKAQAFKLTKLYGAFTWHPDAKRHYEKWYMERVISSDPDVGPFDRTKFIQILKVAMLLVCAKGSDLIMTIEAFELAKSMVDTVIDALPGVFHSMGRNQLADVGTRLLALVNANRGMIRERDAMAALWKDANAGELYQVINHLTTTKQLFRGAKDGTNYLTTQTPPA